MARLDVEALLSPVSDDAPCGADLEYQPAFGELERAARGKEERTMGDSVVPAEPPDWPDVKDRALSLLTETKDLRVAVLLTRASTEVDGLWGLADGLELVQRLTESFWSSVFPLLDAEDDDDPTVRVNSLLALNDPLAVVRSIGRVPLVSTPGVGQFSLRDVRLAAGEIGAGSDEEVPDGALIDAAFAGADIEDIRDGAAAAAAALQTLAALDEFLTEKIGAQSPSFDRLQSEIEAVGKVFSQQLVRLGDQPEGTEQGGDGPATPVSPAPAVAGEIRSRDDVVRSLDRICEYFRKHEPSSPVPLLLERAKRLVDKDFVTIMRDLTPGGLQEAMSIAGIDDDG